MLRIKNKQHIWIEASIIGTDKYVQFACSDGVDVKDCPGRLIDCSEDDDEYAIHKSCAYYRDGECWLYAHRIECLDTMISFLKSEKQKLQDCCD